ncbi:class I SAM-dependent methyltransferase [Embleya scabrispora]|uniref:class I SAM-dependent methyltransferase n=1 Tax=Embleya scabrispora TaxID=159449 RepID=UPI00037DB69A|nr:class I SAM-dependent methyltransferase [Embleya scabrispora]MYS82370.1 methyltransferase domain-containing protein [Streptomyces sp. SID5474]
MTAPQDPPLLDDATLTRSPIVANNAMNRERGLRGVNSYARALGFDPLSRLGPGTAWLDLCCGSGRALFEAAGDPRAEGVRITGVDLVDFFLPAARPAGLDLIAADATGWTAPGRYDLITCVHGLHYVGDRLGLLARIASWLTPTGLFVADFDPAGLALAADLPGELRRQGFEYDARRRRLTLRGAREVEFPYAYLGADDTAGPNYTGQPAVRAHYTGT